MNKMQDLEAQIEHHAEEIASLERRQAELEADIRATSEQLEAAQGEMIDAAPGADERATALQARLSAHEGALQALRKRLEQARREKAGAERAVRQEATTLELQALAEQAEEGQEAYARAYAELRETFEQLYGRIAGASRQWQEANRRFSKILAQVPDEQQGAVHSDLERRGARLKAVEARQLETPEMGPYAAVLWQAVSGAFVIDERNRIRRLPEPAAA